LPGTQANARRHTPGQITTGVERRRTGASRLQEIELPGGSLDRRPARSSREEEAMIRRHPRQLLLGQAVWMVATLVGLGALGLLGRELFIIVSFVGLLIVSEFTVPYDSMPRWRRYLRYAIGTGALLVGAILAGRILDLIAQAS
jgi:hypothetical protein